MSLRKIRFAPSLLALLFLGSACSSGQPSSFTSKPELHGSSSATGTESATPVPVSAGSGVDDPGMLEAPSNFPGNEAAGEQAPESFTGLLWSDARHFVSAPRSWDRSAWTKVGLATVGVAGTALLDEKIRDAVANNSSSRSNSIADAVEPFGSEYSWGVLGAFYLSGRYLHNERAGAVARDGLASSLIAAGALTPLLKATVGRRRPSQTEGTFISGKGGASFPSGHATQAFAIASVIASHYTSPWVKTAAYGLAGVVGWARMENNAHYASDVLAGALIGTIVGRTVVRLHENRRLGLATSHSLDPSAPGVALTFRASSSDFLRFLRRSTNENE